MKTQDLLQIVHSICHVGQSEFGDAYIKKVALQAANELGISYALIGTPSKNDPLVIDTVVVVANGEIVNNFSYELAGTPCENVMSGRRVCTHKENVANEFPQDVLLAQMKVESYMGAPIVDPQGHLRGLFVLLDTKPMHQLGELESVIDFVAARIAIEIYRDIQEKEMQAKLYQDLQRDKLQSLGQLSSGIAHDVNNVLTGILGQMELIKLKIEEESPINRHIDIIFNSTERAKDIARKLLDFSRPETANGKGSSVHATIESICELINHTTHQRLILESDFSAERDRVSIGASELQQVLLNLSINARDAMPDGGHLTFTTRNINKFDVNFIEIVVADTGQGIPEHIQGKIFDEFFTTKEIGRGTGLGLASVKSILSQFEAAISVESELGVGSKFIIHLPIQVSETTGIENENSEPPVDTKSILLLEDEEAIRLYVEEFLRTKGYPVIATASAREAMDAFDKKKDEIDIIVTDMNMPEISGAQFLDYVFESNPDIPCVLCTGDATSSEVVRIGQLENCKIMQKPFLGSEILHCINEIKAR